MSAFARRWVQDPAESHRVRCSFCGRSDRRVRFLVAGKSGGKICNTCCLTAAFIFLKAYFVALVRKTFRVLNYKRGLNDSRELDAFCRGIEPGNAFCGCGSDSAF
jgi:hypothetical protein